MLGDRSVGFPEGKIVDTAPQELDLKLNELLPAIPTQTPHH
ncbi:MULTISPECIES: hypothetical protein [Oscillatoriales]|uniref:Uncharacterized protein n=1 Tax=Limnospira platensis NIES-46 TaxID=1236695 RepID=A0A5M3TCX9_LIMPL|nr:hypothetical protein [Arthrospira platensis]MDF2209443.1 hypothetical protein [Arthrospira platensis NCB002]MDT9296115.1 hypothetical protein [Arthrospira platensis PCC 7345]MDT9311740.1 hypothetical protein [Limnospira sp. Paracas R14]WAK74471.1 hypothetical protein AP9108_34010 [Arthrospira sp. PCC 9108]BDT12485.1 hypothetical protein N39L_22080 [Arthrospira platensis NIES-39]